MAKNLPSGKQSLITSPQELGKLVRQTRTNQGLTQPELAGVSGVGLRFIVDLERGKPTCQLGKALQVVQMLGIALAAMLPETQA